MSYISEAHTEWHVVNGAYNSACPLDCGAMSPAMRKAEDLSNWISYTDEEAGEARTIKCAHCKDRHASVEVVKACASLTALLRDPATSETRALVPAAPAAPVNAQADAVDRARIAFFKACGA
jgi:hypothetical protein